MFRNEIHTYFYRLYFCARSHHTAGSWHHVTFTPKGNNVSRVDCLSRLESIIRSTKAIDFMLLSPEISKGGVYHFHGFLHVKGKCKLKYVRDNELMECLFVRKGSPEGWINYAMKERPNYFVRLYMGNYGTLGLRQRQIGTIANWSTEDFVGKCGTQFIHRPEKK